jgi:hypothetical protein
MGLDAGLAPALAETNSTFGPAAKLFQDLTPRVSANGDGAEYVQVGAKILEVGTKIS